MKVVLPDSSELELPTARRVWKPPARSPKLAEQAACSSAWTVGRAICDCLCGRRANPDSDLRDAQDPDALCTFRHSTAHLLAEAVLRLYPGVKIASAR